MIDTQSAYKWDPTLHPYYQKLRAKGELTREEKQDLQWLTFSHINFLLEGQREGR